MMPLTKDKCFAADHGLLIICDDWEKETKELLKNQEKAEKWNTQEKIDWHAMDKNRKDAEKYIRASIRINKMMKYQEVYERLKKRIKWCEVIIANGSSDFHIGYLKDELQKILGEEK